jgi:hypothetical protein
VPLSIARRHTRLDASWPELRRVERVLAWVCTAFALFGIVVAVGSTSVIFAVYRQSMADALFGGALPPEATTWIAFLYAPIGATFLGHFTMLAWAVTRDRNRAEARWIVAISMLAWFVVDSSTGVMHGAWFNIAMVNVPSLLAVGVPWWLARPRARHPS